MGANNLEPKWKYAFTTPSLEVVMTWVEILVELDIRFMMSYVTEILKDVVVNGRPVRNKHYFIFVETDEKTFVNLMDEHGFYSGWEL